MKYYALVVRPVFQRAVIEIEVENEEERFAAASKAAWKVPDEKWQGRFQPGWYAPYAAEVWAASDFDPGESPESMLNRSWMRYAILEANLEISHGSVLLQPWQVLQFSPDEDLEICGGWQEGLEALYQQEPPLLADWQECREKALRNNIVVCEEPDHQEQIR